MHADLNSFFASVEQQTNPYLRGKPVGIIKSWGRSCVIAASNEAKINGVATGMSLKEIRSVCPDLILVPADFPKYFDVTKRFITLCRRYTDLLEVFSIDEVFLDITRTARWFNGPLELARLIQRDLKEQIGDYLGCSIGIAGNKLLAKMAGGMAPKKSIVRVTPENQAALLAKVPFTEVCGIGYRLTKKLAAVGITSLPQITAVPDEILLPLVGPYWVRELKRIARGEDETPLVPVESLPDAKSVSRSYTLFADASDPAQIKALIRNLSEEAAWKLRQMGLAGRQLGLIIRGEHFSQAGYITNKSCTDSGKQIFTQLQRIYESWRWPHAVRFAGVWVSLLVRKNCLSRPLFPEAVKAEQLTAAVDSINQTYGEYAVFPASLLNFKLIRPETNGYLGDKQFQFRPV